MAPRLIGRRPLLAAVPAAFAVLAGVAACASSGTGSSASPSASDPTTGSVPSGSASGLSSSASPSASQLPSPPKVDPRAATRPTGPFWVDPHSEAAEEAKTNPVFAPLAAQPTALTVTGSLGDPVKLVAEAVAESRRAKQTLILQVYDIPHRDIGGGYSSGGAASAADYLAYTRELARALAGARTIIVLEPDSLGQMDLLSADDQKTRYGLLNSALDIYNGVPDTVVYLDGTNSGWTPAPEMARRLGLAGVERAQGFAVNVSNFYPTDVEATRAEQISALTGYAHFVVDTSRNGGTVIQGNHSSWCNPPDRRIGQDPTTHTGYPRADAYLWIKHPGESDGNCAPGQPAAGQWYASYAEELLRGAG